MFRLLAIADSVSAVLVVLPPFSWMVSAPLALLNVLPSYETVTTGGVSQSAVFTVSWNCSVPTAPTASLP